MTKAIIPILIIGTQRSGSNLLRIMLNQLKEIEAPHPPHILQVFSPLLPVYGNLQDKSNFKKLIDDVYRYTEVNPVKWRNMNFHRSRAFNCCKKKSLIEIFKVLYEMKAEIKGADFWCCKSMANLYYIPQIESENIHPFYIHLIRDGRDVAASFKRTVVGEEHIYFIAQQWKKDQEFAAEMVKKFGANRSTSLYYERFIDDPEKALTLILEKLGLKWNTDILNYFTSEEAKSTAAAGEMWKNVARPVDSTNKKHYSENLSKDEIEIFERIAGSTLLEFGYETENGLNNSPFDSAEIKYFKTENEKMKKRIRELLIKDVAVRIPQEKIIAEIKARSPGYSEI